MTPSLTLLLSSWRGARLLHFGASAVVLCRGVEGENVSITGTGVVIRCCHVHVSSAISNSCLVLGCTLCCFVGGLFIAIPLYFGDDHRRLVGRGRGVSLLAHPLGQPSSDIFGMGG